jgi:hypothetical protein
MEDMRGEHGALLARLEAVAKSEEGLARRVEDLEGEYGFISDRLKEEATGRLQEAMQRRLQREPDTDSYPLRRGSHSSSTSSRSRSRGRSPADTMRLAPPTPPTPPSALRPAWRASPVTELRPLTPASASSRRSCN